MDILPEIISRRSIRAFKPDTVPEERLKRILEAGRLAPSAKNRQEWRFVVIRKKELRRKLQEAAFGQDHVGEAPVLIAACTTNIGYVMPNGQASYPVDLSFAVSFMLLQAVREGLGACCVTTFNEKPILELLTVPFSMRVVCLVALGFPAAIPEPASRKSLRQIVSYDHW